MGGSEEGAAAGAAYAAALRDVVDGFLATGGTQKDIAAALYISQAALSRYLSGDRVASYDFLRKLRAFLEERGLLWDQETGDLLDALCSQAHATSGSPAVQLVQIREELDRLRDEQQHAKRVADTRLADLETQARDLAAKLAQALDHARTTEGARALLQEQVREQDESLRHAQDYIHQIEADLSEQRKQARLLQQEVGVLRKQNQRLVEEQPHTVSGVSTQDTGMEAILAQRRTRTAQASTSGPHRPPVAPARKSRSSGDRYSPELHTFDRARKRTRVVLHSSVSRPKASCDTVFICLALVVTGALGTGLSAGFQAEPGLSIARLTVAVLAVLAGAIVCWFTVVALGDKYLMTKWASVPGADRMLLGAVPLMLITATVAPFYLETDLLGRWLADVAGLL
ncbi:helix-turn-helix domain-containing protein [Streptomyces sp. JH34]|uniref:helix-turn-helix domain-containing protein n=1 Tax=Streptomyces sp. JH34 TaxID=2793633 RepID=UPI0023F6531C|nr:helix-turn-helix domain-containing protein [Streptomyces sp. JH34]MDF6016907.1 helix-turn-helix domain-containing protein [Streptomyces sp. JH34]MDF6023131.1 helix-turn-helix domain-containing protein [Streptomyces sp. JH34]